MFPMSIFVSALADRINGELEDRVNLEQGRATGLFTF